MVTFIILCIIFFMVDEAIKKHGDVKTLIEKIKNIEE